MHARTNNRSSYDPAYGYRCQSVSAAPALTVSAARAAVAIARRNYDHAKDATARAETARRLAQANETARAAELADAIAAAQRAEAVQS